MTTQDMKLIFNGAIALESALSEANDAGKDIGNALGHAQAILAILSEKFPEIANELSE